MSRHTTRAAARKPEFRLAALGTAKEAIGTLDPGVRIVGVTKGQFGLLEIIRAIVEQTGPAHLVLATWGLGKDDVEHVEAMVERGDVTGVEILTDRSVPTRHNDQFIAACRLFGGENVWLTRLHAKFVMIRAGNWRIVIRSSMNLNANPRLEQFDIDDDEAIFNFYQEIVDELKRDLSSGELYINRPEAAKRNTEQVFRDIFTEKKTKKRTSVKRPPRRRRWS